MMLASFCSLAKRHLQWPRHKTPQNDRLYARPSTRKKDIKTECLHRQLTCSH